MYKRAVILAGGKGTRLKPYTIAIPKPLVPIIDTPILEIIIRKLIRDGFEHITISLNHMAEIIKAFCGDGSKWNIKIDYAFEEKPLGTMGPLLQIDSLPDNFIVMNGDVLTDLDLNIFYKCHLENKNLFTIASSVRREKIDYGVLETDESSRLIGFTEKPEMTFRVSMGIYAVSREILKEIPPGQYFGFDDLMLHLISQNKHASVYDHKGYWLDIGRPDDYERAVEEYPKMKEGDV